MSRRVPGKVTLSTEEMVIGDFSDRVIQPPEAWAAALKVQHKVHAGFHLLKSVRVDIPAPGEPRGVDPRREDKIYDAVPLAGRLMREAVAYEMPVLMVEITELLDAEAEKLDAQDAAIRADAEN